MKDVIIVGSGIAGCALAWKWLLQGKSVAMISNQYNASSSVAAGVYNPTVLKRFTPVWKAQEQLDIMLPFYKSIERQLGFTLLHDLPLLRRLHDDNEVKTWKRKALREDLSAFMHPEVFNDLGGDAIFAPHGFGKVNHTGWCDTVLYMKATIDYLKFSDSFVQETFDHESLEVFADHVVYKDMKAKHVIFAEGFAMCHNPYYNHLPLQGNKGELLIVRIADLRLDYIIKSSVFLMHYKDDLFWVGATYDRDDMTNEPTSNALDYLTSRLETFLKLPYEIVEHKVGIRPTTQDRRPFVGTTCKHKRHYIFNGMGSRAVLLAPWAATQLYENIYNDVPLDSEIDCNRYKATS